MSTTPRRILIWNEFRHEKSNAKAKAIYPDGMHRVIADALSRDADLIVSTATLDEGESAISEDKLAKTDLIVWWGHLAHGEVSDEAAERVCRAIWNGCGALFLHSAHFSKPFKRLMGTGCDLKWREADEREILWVTRPGHPLVDGIEDRIVLPQEEMYGEFFDVPEPEETVMISSFAGGEVCRSLMTWSRGAGRVVYFRPGHETYPTYHNAQIIQVIRNACHWASRRNRPVQDFGKHELGWLER